MTSDDKTFRCNDHESCNYDEKSGDQLKTKANYFLNDISNMTNNNGNNSCIPQWGLKLSNFILESMFSIILNFEHTKTAH